MKELKAAINLLNEAKLQKQFIQVDSAELQELKAKILSGDTSKKTIKRARELQELIDGHHKWLSDNEKKMKNAASLLQRRFAA